MKNGVQLITYPDSLGGTISGLSDVLERYFPGAFSGVHLLPFYPSSADRGFAPVSYNLVDPAFGTWAEVEALARRYDVTVDFMVNHISRQSPEFLDYREKGGMSPWGDLFLQVRKIFPDGEIPPSELGKIYTRKPRAPVTEVLHPDGTVDTLWCTFSEEQIDLDVTSDTGRRFIESNIRSLCRRGIAMLRLDAFAYVTKRAGTNCFFVEPEVWDVLSRIRRVADEYGVQLLPEIHEHYSYQLKLAEKGYRVYDFALPMLMLHTLYTRSTRRLKEWLSICPRNQVTTLDTHDGLGVVDAVDLLTKDELDAAVDNLYHRGSSVNRRYSTAEYNNLDIYQINCTYYSALGEDDDAYILSRAVQFFAPGIPQVYYVGALSGRNDTELVERTKQGRDINRHSYSVDELEGELQRPVNRRLQELLTFRSAAEVFDGDFEVLESGETELVIRRTGKAGGEAVFTADLKTLACRIDHTSADGSRESIKC
ncbi:MAG: sucrose phosphorylase [Spirochaetales bacterium]|nr:sucrose phosphorylase [Spirochaetales bacterium]